VERPTSISPGIQTLVTFSTDVVVADVLETNPSKAMEGARDTVKLKVVRTLLGRPVVGDVLGVYYHLLWSDEKGEVLESPKFLKGKRYVVFLQSHRSRTPEGERVEYQLTDQWLSVLPDHVHLVKEVVAAIRTAHGDSRGEWSSTDGSIAGLQGRLVAYREAPATGNTPFIIVFLDLRNTAGGDNTTEFNLDAAKVVWTVTDAKGKAVDPVSPPGSWKSPPPRKLTLEAKQSGRLPVTVSGAGVFQGKAGHLDFGVDQVWEFAQGEGPFFLSGKIKIEPIAQARTWYGTMDLPKVRIPLGE
jgi:hypothetical protein